jgi:Flp pilus assembly pilin Flp
MLTLYRYFRPLVKDEKGQTVTEYALIFALIVLIAIATFPTIGSKVSGIYSTLYSQLSRTA